MLYPCRPSFGESGKPVVLWVNHFGVTVRADQGDVYHYDAAIADEGKKPGHEPPPKSLCTPVLHALIANLKVEYPDIAVVADGRRNIYTNVRFPFESRLFKVAQTKDDKVKMFDVHVKASDPLAIRMTQINQLFEGTLNYTPYDAIQALDIAMRYSASTRFVSIGRNLFNNFSQQSLGEGGELWFGYHQSLRPTQSHLTLNVDMASSMFIESMPALVYMCEACGFREVPATLNKMQKGVATKVFRGIKVRVTHRGQMKRGYRVNGLTKSSANDTFIEIDGNRISVASYFATNYLPLQYPNLQMLHVGSPTSTNYLPIEVCHTVEGQRFLRKATESQLATMVRVTCTPPEERRQKIEARVQEGHFSDENCLDAFGIELNPTMLTVEGRQLPEPALLYGGSHAETPRDGLWNMKNKSFFQTVELKSFAIVSLCDTRRCPTQSIVKLFRHLLKGMNQVDMKGPATVPPVVVQQNGQTIEQLLSVAIGAATTEFGARPQLVFCINPQPNAQNYGDLKRASDILYGIPSQMMLSRHFVKPSVSYISTLLLKVNTKLGGRNTVCKDALPRISTEPTIIFGADVSHPSPMDTTRPSIAAVVASMDRWGVRHAATMRKQAHRMELIEDMEGMATELLKRFYQATNRKPVNILFYRDGVSEGQFESVLIHEVAALRSACEKLEKDYRPRITYVVVQKRHNTRFFPTDLADADRSANVKAGTVIDSGVCHPTEYDFYLMSHSGIQGTSRPAHYHVLLDEIGFTPDELHNLTFRLCYTFARCTRSVSVVPSVYYSHLVAFRARFFMQYDHDSESTVDESQLDYPLPLVHKNLHNAMYYV
ncbi:unnamed protein product [Aphanomyces euteiches]|uniref:Piwi domain-containing protein n=1 Tax=Aphanomyces euteiches TaxID=100861 RepID=A0A6G0W609_9STRA|nr:hypothetical protein Ae201684_018813 [Aphanomyces euteiches]KAH9061622.1 hypothetical protein Ae201684P_020957 [Aphanomyces euteiches]KAH9140961.1 hypothetical protein AeRB84_014820 [Aphanomyces euteiches]